MYAHVNTLKYSFLSPCWTAVRVWMGWYSWCVRISNCRLNLECWAHLGSVIGLCVLFRLFWTAVRPCVPLWHSSWCSKGMAQSDSLPLFFWLPLYPRHVLWTASYIPHAWILSCTWIPHLYFNFQFRHYY